jgi:hypothetical protein
VCFTELVDNAIYVDNPVLVCIVHSSPICSRLLIDWRSVEFGNCSLSDNRSCLFSEDQTLVAVWLVNSARASEFSLFSWNAWFIQHIQFGRLVGIFVVWHLVQSLAARNNVNQ